jgi:hypothetical protein
VLMDVDINNHKLQRIYSNRLTLQEPKQKNKKYVDPSINYLHYILNCKEMAPGEEQ